MKTGTLLNERICKLYASNWKVHLQIGSTDRVRTFFTTSRAARVSYLHCPADTLRSARNGQKRGVEKSMLRLFGLVFY
jgi:hypothetical protein